MREILVDTGVLIAIADRRDAHHAACVAFAEGFEGRLKILPTVVTETAWMLERYLSPEAEAGFLDSVAAGQLDLVAMERRDLARMADLVRKYADFPLGTVDASVIAVAERLGLAEVATLDRRHFAAVRPQHVKAFTLLP
ncbi:MULTISPECIES: type II toxin-antitoxin system VapC family toxin [Streptomyces]|uniref:Ribonuclease VapC n=1 Tax=Streptomyces huasconensis TaxID=1854574 RepID=A0ABV3M536_9ACTN|nr:MULTISPECIES: PIN domain-containing protein [Streptomyces]UFQ16069.1 PIN domain-containing protein [Streptomyces huasconensis]WCL85672.1 PIN domain-containing protein [Streptomyces sp. JCM 35825]